MQTVRIESRCIYQMYKTTSVKGMEGKICQPKIILEMSGVCKSKRNYSNIVLLLPAASHGGTVLMLIHYTCTVELHDEVKGWWVVESRFLTAGVVECWEFTDKQGEEARMIHVVIDLNWKH